MIKTLMLFRTLSSLALSALVAAGCKTTPDAAGERQAAVLEKMDDAVIDELKATLSEAVGRARIELGPEDLTKGSVISVLPPPLSPYEQNSVAMPTQFDLVVEGARCLLVQRDTGRAFELEGIPCKRAAP